MPRLARAIVPGLPHHITQRGNRRQRTFFEEGDYTRYLALMSEWCRRCEVDILAWCLMPNHVHLVAVPPSAEGLRRAVGEAHRRYTVEVNRREGWRGHLWQGRFASFAMDDRHTLAATRYIELNPVRAGLVTAAADYPWSSARAHLARTPDALVNGTLPGRVGDWAAFLGAASGTQGLADELHRHETTGRPLGDDDFVDRVELRLRRVLTPRRPGPVPWTPEVEESGAAQGPEQGEDAAA